MCLDMVDVKTRFGQQLLHDGLFANPHRMDSNIPPDKLLVVRYDSQAFPIFQNPDILKVTFVRDPVDRFVSGYLNRIIQTKASSETIERPMIMTGLRSLLYHLHLFVDQYRQESQLMTIFQNETNLNSYSIIPPEFPKDVSNNINLIANHAEKYISKLINAFGSDDTSYIHSHALDYVDEHFHPLAARCGHRYYKYDFIGKVESFDDDLSRMFVELNRSDLISRYIVSPEKEKSTNPSDIDISLWVRGQLTELDLRIIKFLYREDYSLFDYL